jgi:DNA-binding transcriptional MerR regulator
MQFRIGEFSRITSLSVKSLRLYHEREILVPAVVDPATGYRYYDESNLERAQSVQMLKRFDFSLAEIKELLDDCDDESDMLLQLESKLKHVESKIDRFQEISIEERELDTILIAGHRMVGRYKDVGKGLGFVCRKMGRHANGKPMTLYYDDEYKEEDADFEPCVPVRKGKDVAGISVRELKGGTCVSLVHKGPYDTLNESYKKVFAYINEKGYNRRGPIREVYHKGPGLILKGNPKNYLTEIQAIIEE